MTLSSGTAVFVPRPEAVGVANAMIEATLVNYGANAKIQDNNGDTPLHLAARTETLKTVKLLTQNNNNCTSFIIAC